MNTPSSKPPARAIQRKKPSKRPPPSTGRWEEGIFSEEHAMLVGQIITWLPHIEELMIVFMAKLLNHPPIEDGPSRQVFRSIESERARIEVMKSLLEVSSHNSLKPPVFDEVIELFRTVKNRRNAVAHGLWFTHENGKIYYADLSADTKPTILATRRVVPIGELQEDVKRMELLVTKVREAIAWVDPHPIPIGGALVKVFIKGAVATKNLKPPKP